MDNREYFESDQGKPILEEMQVRSALKGLKQLVDQELAHYEVDVDKARPHKDYERVIEGVQSYIEKAQINLAEWKRIGSAEKF